MLLLSLLVCGCAFSPDDARRNHVLRRAQPELPASAIQVVAELDWPPGNVAVGPDGRVYFTFHPEAGPPGTKLAELRDDGSVAPFPDAGWQQEREDGPSFVTPLGVRVDAAGRLWVLDHGDYGGQAPSLTAFDTVTRRVVHGWSSTTTPPAGGPCATTWRSTRRGASCTWPSPARSTSTRRSWSMT